MSRPLMKHDTREKIIRASVKLFAEKGYKATTIREIAKLAQVNVALINYHFENKQNLYSQVVQDNWHWLDARMKEIALGCGADSNLFATRMFELLKSNSHQAMNSFKILLNEDIQIPTPLASGPPGGQYLLQIIRDEVGEKITEDACQWAMQAIFAQVVHLGIMTSSVIARNNASTHFSSQNLKLHISLLVKAILSYIKSAPSGRLL